MEGARNSEHVCFVDVSSVLSHFFLFLLLSQEENDITPRDAIVRSGRIRGNADRDENYVPPPLNTTKKIL